MWEEESCLENCAVMEQIEWVLKCQWLLYVPQINQETLGTKSPESRGLFICDVKFSVPSQRPRNQRLDYKCVGYERVQKRERERENEAEIIIRVKERWEGSTNTKGLTTGYQFDIFLS